MKKLIVNGDDFGLSKGINRGIQESYRDGILTSTSMMVNLPGFEDAVRIAKDHPELGVGIHINLLWGAPVTDPGHIKTLVQRNGQFNPRVGSLALKHYSGFIARKEIEEEIRNQVRKFTDTGLVPTHIDSHLHLQILAGVLDAMLQVAGEFNIKNIRFPVESSMNMSNMATDNSPWKTRIKIAFINFLTRSGEGTVKACNMNFPDYFFGIGLMRHPDVENLLSILEQLPDGMSELMCHPGYMDETATRYSKIPPYREKELATLTSPDVIQYIEQTGIQLIHYGALENDPESSGT